MAPQTELDVLGIVSERLEALAKPYMLTGSFALAYYATPRMTRDIDIVVALEVADVIAVVEAFSVDFYVDGDTAHEAVRDRRPFNLMHLSSGIKVARRPQGRCVSTHRIRASHACADGERRNLDHEPYVRSWAQEPGVGAELEKALHG